MQNKAQIKLACYHWTVVSCSIYIVFILKILLLLKIWYEKSFSHSFLQHNSFQAELDQRSTSAVMTELIWPDFFSLEVELIISLQAKCKKSTAVYTKPQKTNHKFREKNNAQ